jgi:hypothetical protein
VGLPPKRCKWDESEWGDWQYSSGSGNWESDAEWLRSSKASINDLERASIPFLPPTWWPDAAAHLVRASPAWIRAIVSLHIIDFKTPAALKQSLHAVDLSTWWEKEPKESTLATAITLPAGLSLVQKQDAASILADLTTILASASTVHTPIWSHEFKSALVDPTEKGVAGIEKEILRLVNNRTPDYATFAQGLAGKFRRIPVVELLCHLLNTRQAELFSEIKIRFHSSEMGDLSSRLSTVLATKDPRSTTTKTDIIYALALIVAQTNTPGSSLDVSLRNWGSSHAQRHVAQSEMSTLLLSQSASWPLSTTASAKTAVSPPYAYKKWDASDWQQWNYQTQLDKTGKGRHNQDKGGKGSHTREKGKGKGGKIKGKGGGATDKNATDLAPIVIGHADKYKTDYTPTGYMLFAYEQTLTKNPNPALVDVLNVYNTKCAVNGDTLTVSDVKRLLLAAKKLFNVRGKFCIRDWE